MDAQQIYALNELLEDERASVEILIALTAMATDSLERQALTVMGGQAAQACADLHEALARQDASISRKVSAAAGRVVAPEHLDTRFYAYAELQEQMAQRIASLPQPDLDAPTQGMLTTLQAMHLAHAAWVAQRADEFVASRRQAEEAARLAHAAGPDAAREAAPDEAAHELAHEPAHDDAAAPDARDRTPAPSSPEPEPEPAHNAPIARHDAAPDVQPVESVAAPEPVRAHAPGEHANDAALPGAPPLADEAGAFVEPRSPRPRRSRLRVLEDAPAAHDDER